MGVDEFVTGGDVQNPAVESLETDESNNTKTPASDANLQNLIDELGDGGTIQLRSNTVYELPTGLTVSNDNFSIVGPRSAVLKFPSDGVGDSFITIGGSSSGDNFTASGFTIDGSNQTDPTNDGTENTPDGHGIFFDDEGNVGVERGVVENVYLKDIAEEAITSFGHTISSEDKWIQVKNNVIERPGYRGIHPHIGHSMYIEGNIIRDITANGFDTAIRHGHIISDNVIHRVTANGTRGIFGSDDKSIISGNLITNWDADNATGIQSWQEKDNITGNTIDRMRGSGTVVGIQVHRDRVKVTDNLVDQVEHYGIQIFGDRQFVQVHGNFVGDTITGGDSIRLNGPLDCSIKDNVLTASGPSPSTHINEVSGSGADANVIAENLLDESASTPISKEGTNTVVRNNKGYVTENSGSASVSDGGAISHGLDVTPPLDGVLVWTNSTNRAYPTAVDSTNITVSLEDPSGASVGAAETVYFDVQ